MQRHGVNQQVATVVLLALLPECDAQSTATRVSKETEGGDRWCTGQPTVVQLKLASRCSTGPACAARGATPYRMNWRAIDGRSVGRGGAGDGVARAVKPAPAHAPYFAAPRLLPRWCSLAGGGDTGSATSRHHWRRQIFTYDLQHLFTTSTVQC